VAKVDEASSEFKDEANLRQFYELIATTQTDEGNEVRAKITTANEVRELKNILGSPEAKLVLSDPTRSFLRPWRSRVQRSFNTPGQRKSLRQIRHFLAYPPWS